MKLIIRKILNSLGYDILTQKALNELKYSSSVHIDHKVEYSEFYDIYEACKPYTMTSIERMYALYKSVEFIVKNNIEGDFVECGVWRGGSTMVIAKTLQKFNVNDRLIYLYDTFSGMSSPKDEDKDVFGNAAQSLLANEIKNEESIIWAYASLRDVKANMALTGYPVEKIFYVEGKVEDTIPKTLPKNHIALLRLDTDWYDSTIHELEHLYPQLIENGVLIIDDYGHWQGAKMAVDEYLTKNNYNILLSRIDYTGRIAIKS